MRSRKTVDPLPPSSIRLTTIRSRRRHNSGGNSIKSGVGFLSPLLALPVGKQERRQKKTSFSNGGAETRPHFWRRTHGIVQVTEAEEEEEETN